MARNPRKVVAAIVARGETVAGIELRQVTASTMAILEKLDHPIAREQAPDSDLKLSNDDIIRLLFVLTHAAGESYDLIQRNAFDRAAYEAADAVAISDLPAVGAAIRQLFAAAFATVIGPEKKTATTSSARSPTAAPTAGS